MTMTLDAVLRAIPKLSDVELNKVKARLSAVSSLKGGRIDSSASTDFLLEGIHAELRRRGLLGQRARLGGPMIPAHYAAAAARVRELLLEQYPDLSPTEQAALGQLAARTLASYLERVSKQISPQLLLSSVSLVPAALDRAFPGYLEAGMLRWCW